MVSIRHLFQKLSSKKPPVPIILKQTLGLSSVKISAQSVQYLQNFTPDVCLIAGNDFLPHLPSLEIREGAIDRLIRLYKKAVYSTGGYLTDSGKVHMNRVQFILAELGETEDIIFKERQAKELEFRRFETGFFLWNNICKSLYALA